MGPIVTAATTDALPAHAIVLHVEVDPSTAEQAFERGHIPGARLVLRDELTAREVGPGDGRHPLPTPEAFAAALGRCGIDERTQVLAYDRERGTAAARLVYLLRLLGQDAALLDGGIDGFEDPLATGAASPPEPVEVAVRPWPGARLPDADEVAAHISAGGLVVDARDGARFAGEVEPIDAVAGHIPGAVSAPFADNLDARGLFRAPPTLHARFEPMGAGPDTIAYCGSGVTACHDLLAIEHAGLGLGRLYVGSWSQWSGDSARPVGTGPS